MRGEQKEHWMELCELAANEHDPERLTKLTTEIIRLLEEKERRLKSVTQATGDST